MSHAFDLPEGSRPILGEQQRPDQWAANLSAIRGKNGPLVEKMPPDNSSKKDLSLE
jgi:hypothetical protein